MSPRSWRRSRFRVRVLLVLVALAALGMRAPDWWCQAAHYWKRRPTLDALERPVSFHFSRGESLEHALERVRKSSVSPRLALGLRLFVDNSGLGEADLSGLILEEPLRADLDVRHLPTKDVLALLLDTRGMKYVLSEPNAHLTITSQGADGFSVDSIDCYVERYLIDRDGE